MGKGHSKLETSDDVIAHVSTLVNYVLILYSSETADEIQHSSRYSNKKERINRLSKELGEILGHDLGGISIEDIRNIVCSQIRSLITKLYTMKLAEESERVFTSRKGLTRKGGITGSVEGGGISIEYGENVTKELVFTREFVKDFVHRSISTLLPSRPQHIVKDRYNSMVKSVVALLDVIDEIHELYKLEDNDRAIVDDILENRKKIAYCTYNHPRDENFDNSIFSIIYEVKRKIRTMKNVELKMKIRKNAIDCHRAVMGIADKKNEIEITYVMLSEIMNDFTKPTSTDIKYAIEEVSKR